MRNRKAAEVDADVEARIVQIEQMTLGSGPINSCGLGDWLIHW